MLRPLAYNVDVVAARFSQAKHAEVSAIAHSIPEVSLHGLKDPAFVTSTGESLVRLPEGAGFYEVPTHSDERGTVVEMFDTRWNWHPDPVHFVYSYTLRPNCVKGWAMHLLQEDRYFVLAGEMKIVLFDARLDSPTHGEVSHLVLSHYHRRIFNIPRGVWHVIWNIGLVDVIAVNLPTLPYDHANPDKYRLPLDTDQIPFRFPSGVEGF